MVVVVMGLKMSIVGCTQVQPSCTKVLSSGRILRKHLSTLCIPFWFLLSPSFKFYKINLSNYRPQRSCRKVMFLHLSVSHSVHGGCIPACTGADTPPGKHPRTDTSQADIPLVTHRLARHTPGQTTPGQTPPCPVHVGIHPLPSACWDTHGYCCGWYASYWNAFLL